MSQANNISNSYSFIAFCRMNGRLRKVEFTNKTTGEVFHSLVYPDQHVNPTTGQPIITKDGKEGMLSVSFSSKLGELTAQELNTQRHQLQVVRLNSGSYKLCKKNEFGEEIHIDLD